VASRTAILAIRIIADAAGGKKGLDATATSVQKFERGVSDASTKAAGALAALGAGALFAANRASELAESSNAVAKTFGPASKTIEAFGKTAAKSAGLAQAEFQTLAVRTGSLLTNMGYSQQAAADQTTVLAQRAADMASVFNTDVSTALEAVNAGLRGEAEPLRAFGVGLSDAAIKSQAMTMGLYDGTGALDSHARAQAATALIMAQTAKTAGDFGDTADSMANRQRIAAAQATNLAAAFGTELLPAVESLLGMAQKLLGVIEDHPGPFKAAALGAAALAAAVLATNAAFKVYRAGALALTVAQKVLTATQLRQTAATIAARVAAVAVRTALLVWTAAQWALNVALNANPIGLVVLAVAALVGAVVLAYKRSDTFRTAVNALGRALATTLGAAIRAVSSAISALVGWLKTAWDWLSRMIAKVGELAGKLNPLKSLGNIIGGSRSVATYATAGTVPTTYRATAYTTTTERPAPAYATPTDEQLYRAVWRLLERGNARNGRPGWAGA
jgi:hypothetical protein